MQVRVLKVGGSCLAGAADYAALSGRARAEGAGVVVVSACRGVTDALVACVDRAERGDPPACQDLARLHLDLIAGLPVAEREEAGADLEGLLEELARRLEALAGAGAPDPWARDALLGLGERLSLVVALAHARAGGRPARGHVAEEVGILTTAEPGAARVLPEGAALARARLAPRPGLDLVAGYVGRTPEGRWTTLGRGGSDVTAVFLAWALGGEAILCKDTPGILSADPALVGAARPVARLEPHQALALAQGGSPVVALAALELAAERGVLLSVRPWRGGGPGTQVGPGPGAGRAITCRATPGGARVTLAGGGVEALLPRVRSLLAGVGETPLQVTSAAGVVTLEVTSGATALRALHPLCLGLNSGPVSAE